MFVVQYAWARIEMFVSCLAKGVMFVACQDRERNICWMPGQGENCLLHAWREREMFVAGLARERSVFKTLNISLKVCC